MEVKHRSLTFVISITIALGACGAWAAPVTFNDNNLLNAVKTQWEAATGLTLSDPPEDTELADARFTSLVAKNLEITDLTGLEACVSLTDLNLGWNHISDLTPLTGLTGLLNLDLGFGVNPFRDSGNGFDPLQTGTNLITDIAPLAGLVNLSYLNLMGNDALSNLEAIRTMDSLSELWLASNPIVDFSPLSDVADTLGFFAEINCGLKQSDLPIINSMTNLQGLGILGESNITDISGLTGISPSQVFAVMLVPVTDIGVVSGYTQLQMLQVQMTEITAIPDLSGFTNLQRAGFGSNPSLTDISGLNGVSSLHDLDLRECQISDISALSTCTGLQRLDLSGNQLTDIQPLLDNTGIAQIGELRIYDNAFAQGTPYCEEHQLDQLYALAPGINVQENSICGAAVNLTILVNGTGTTNPEPGTRAMLQGAYQYVNAYPISGSGQAFINWSGDLVSANMNENIFMDTDKTVTANFGPGDWTFTLNKAGYSGGGTWPNPGVYSYLDGQSAYASINSSAYNEGYFSGWTGDVTGYRQNINFMMDGNKSVTANFVSSGYVLSLRTQGGEGGIDGFSSSNGAYKYAAGASFDLRANIWNSAYRFDHWEGDIGDGVDPYSTVLPVTMDRDRAITAVLVEDFKTLTIIIDGAGSTNPEGSVAPGTQHVYGTNQGVSVQAVLNAAVALDYWSGDIGSNSATSTRLWLIMDQDRTVTAHFSSADWTLTLQKTGNGLIDPVPGVYGFMHGGQINLSAQLVSGGDAFSGWTGDIDSYDARNLWMYVTMNRNRTITANFAPGDWTLTVTKSGSSLGNVYPNPGIYQYLNGRTASFSANSNSSAYFAGWTGDITSDNPNINVTMDGNKTVNASFASSGYLLIINTSGGGWTNFGGYQYLASGMEPMLTASAPSGYQFGEWTGDVPEGVDASSPSIPVLMDRNRTLTANFILNQKKLTIIIEGQGSTTPAGGPSPGIEHGYTEGEQVYIAADFGTDGWAFSHWSGDIGSNDPLSRFIQVAMNTDRTVVANYRTADWLLTVGFTGNGSTWPEPGTYGFMDGAEVEAVANIYPGGDAFDHWEGLPEGADSFDVGPRFQIHGDITATALFGPGDYTLTTTVAGGGTAEYLSHPAGVYQYIAGRNANLEVRPLSTTYWGGYSGDLNTYDYFYRLLMDGNKNVQINLGTSGYALTVDASGGGTTEPSGTARFMAGATPMIHAFDVGAYLFNGWTGQLPSGIDPLDRDPEILMDQNRTLTANFVEADWYLYIQKIGNGSTDPAPDLYWYLGGAAFAVTATPGEDFLFLEWQGDVPAGQDRTVPAISGIMDRNRELIALFVPVSVSVPDLLGKTQAQAEAALAVLGLVLGTVSSEYSDAVPLGQVISQEPDAAASVAYGAAVSIVVSLGPCIAPVPNLAGFTQAEAETALAAAHLSLGVVTQENSAAVPAGHIIRQDPVFGLSVACDSAVEVVLSLGPVIEGEGEEGELEGEGETGCHTADQNCDGLVNLSELLRAIQFFNSGGYHCESGTEDGYAPGLGDTNCAPHASDYMPQDWQINLSELLRLIQFFNSGGYHYCPEENTEDGFCPGTL